MASGSIDDDGDVISSVHVMLSVSRMVGGGGDGLGGGWVCLLRLRRILSICEEKGRQGIGTLVLLINISDRWTFNILFGQGVRLDLTQCYQKSGVVRGNFPTV